MQVREECGVVAELDGRVSLTHNHGWRFGQGDLYVLVKMRALAVLRSLTLPATHYQRTALKYWPCAD